MSFETDFDSAFTILLGKAVGAITPTGVLPTTPPTTTTTTTTGSAITSAIEYVIDGGGSVITAGVAGGLIVPFNCVITQVELQEFNGTSGSITVDIQGALAGNIPSFASLCGGNRPHLTLSRHYSDSTLSGWSTTLDRGDALRYVSSAITSVTRVTVMLYVRRTD